MLHNSQITCNDGGFPPITLSIIGAQKAGTSSFLRYLVQHPQTCSHRQPEMNFFVNNEEFGNGYPQAFKRYFHCAKNNSSVLVAKSVGILDSPSLIRRIYEHNHKMQVVVLLRNPVDRAYSAYWYARRAGCENLKRFEDALEANPSRFAGDRQCEQACSYLERGIYINKIKCLFTYFPSSQVHIFLLEDLKQDAIGICQRLYEACGIAADFVPEINFRYNVATKVRLYPLTYLVNKIKLAKRMVRLLLPPPVADNIKSSINEWNQKQFDLPTIQPETRDQLLAFFRPFNDELSYFLNRDLSHWNF
jgi:hypothetical protein